MKKIHQKIIIDIALAIVFIVIMAPNATGVSLHEWISLFGGVILVAHLVISWDWIVAVSGKFFKNLPGKTRLNYILNILLYLAIILTGLSGFMISESLAPFFNFKIVPTQSWNELHDISANLFMILTGVHLGLHWNWIKTKLNLFSYIKPKSKSQALQPERNI